MALLLVFVLHLRAYADSPPAARPIIPLCPGLTIVTAVTQPQGDYESIKRIESVSAEGIRLRYSSYMPDPEGDYDSTTVAPPPWVPFMVYRSVRRADLEAATAYLQQFAPVGIPETVPGTTAFGISSALYGQLKSKGAISLTVYQPVVAGAPLNPERQPGEPDYRLPGEIARADPTPTTVSMIVNDRLTALPALRAKGKFLGTDAEFLLLDDPGNPLALRFRIGDDRLQVIKISHSCAAAELPPSNAGDSGGDGRGGGLGGDGADIPPPGAESAAQVLERALAETGRAEIYSLYFDFNSTKIREESDPTLQVVATIMNKHPDWKLTVEGHTDNIARDAYNLDLSKRRAAAVVATLAAQYGVDAKRFASAGLGESRPKDTNETVEGRARNRRVELVRMP